MKADYIDAVLQLRKEGHGYKTIAKKVGKSRDRVRGICLKNGLGGVGGLGGATTVWPQTAKVKRVYSCVDCGVEIIKTGPGPRIRCEKCKGNRKCKECGKRYKPNQNLFCSNNCKLAYAQRTGKLKHYVLECAWCGKAFASITDNKYCSVDCRGQSDRTLKGTTRVCVICSKEYEPSFKEIQCCSKACGKKLETRTKRAQADRLAQQLTEEELSARRRQGWRYIAWREAVYKRDNYCCVKCGRRRSRDINAHHIMSFADNPKKRFDPQNGATLCEACHVEFHQAYGYGNNNAEQLEHYLRRADIAL